MMNKKKKIASFSKIVNNNSRNITYGKRHKGLLKKAMELSMLCDQKIFISIYDERKGKLVQFSSNEEYTLKDVVEVDEKHNSIHDSLYEHYIDEDYELFSEANMPHVDKNETVIGMKRLEVIKTFPIFESINLKKDKKTLKHEQKQLISGKTVGKPLFEISQEA